MAGYDNNGINDLGDGDVTMEDTDMMSNDNVTTDMLEEYGVWVKVEPEVIEEEEEEEKEEKTDEEHDYLTTLDDESVDDTDSASIEVTEKDDDLEHISFDDLEIPSEEDIDTSEFDVKIDQGEEKAGIEDMEELSIDDFLGGEETGEVETKTEEGIDEGLEEGAFEESEEGTGDADIDISLEGLEEEAEQEITEDDLIPGLEEEIYLSEEEMGFDEGEVEGIKEESETARLEKGEALESMDIEAGEDIEDLSEDDFKDIEMTDIPELELEENIDGMAMDTGEKAIDRTSEDTFTVEDISEDFEISGEDEGKGTDEIEVPLSEKMPEQRFDDLETIETDLKTSMPKKDEFESIDTTSILNKIEKELYSIKEDLAHLKKDLSELRKPSLAPGTGSDMSVSSPDTSGFFDQEEDETIALTGDELNNILNTAEITEEEAEETAVADEDITPKESKGKGVQEEEKEIEISDAGIESIELEETPIEETWDEPPQKGKAVQKKPSLEMSDEEVIDDFATDSISIESDTGEFIEVDSTGEESLIKDDIEGFEEIPEMELDEGMAETEIKEKITDEDEIELEEGFTDESVSEVASGTEESISDMEEIGGETESLSEDLLALDEEVELEIPEEEVFEEKDGSLKESGADDVFFDADEEETSMLEAEIDEAIASDFQDGKGGIEETDIEDLIAEEDSFETIDKSHGGEKGTLEDEEEVIDVSIPDEELELELPEEEIEETEEFDVAESEEVDAGEEEIGGKKEEAISAEADKAAMEEIDISEFGLDEDMEDIKTKKEEKTVTAEEEPGTEAEEPSLVDETPEEITITAEEPAMTPSFESPEDHSGEIEIFPETLKNDLKSVLSYMDELLENLPDDKIKEFSRSNYWITYKKLFEELGIAPKDSEIYSEKL
jgi:pilus assembly protein FimV